jgi:predicted carbohydrate-binding protein with CBM5 and CBM33 domain
VKKRRKLAAAMIPVLLALGTVVALPGQASAHGVAMVPGARTFFCYRDGLTNTGEIKPTNPACQAAVAQSGTTPLYNWFAVLHSSAAGRTSGFIPDGSICSAGNGSPFNFSPYNAARTDWPLTHLTSGATIQWRYNNWAHHPGKFDLYITRNGWNPSSPLTWADLERFTTVQDPPSSGGPGGFNYYFSNIQLPAGKSGQHILLAHWIRSDSPENFYSCSDVVFDGGNGEVTGIRPGALSPALDETAFHHQGSMASTHQHGSMYTTHQHGSPGVTPAQAPTKVGLNLSTGRAPLATT